MDNKQDGVDLLNRVALRLEQRGIGPASDIEKLKALAYELEHVKDKTTDANTTTVD